VGKNIAALLVTDSERRRLLAPVDFAMSEPPLAAVLERGCAVLPAGLVKVGIEAAGHFTDRCWGLGCGQRAGRCWS